ncbi:MAG: adenosylcobinamide-GDP ribazoletransferase [Flavobacteriaceae bacterium]
MRDWIDDLIACLRFFTRLPTGADDHSMPDFARSSRAAPLVGVVVGLIGAAVLAAGAWATGSAAVGAILAVAAGLLATGCFHEDGLADTADGFGGGWSAADKLAIMKDSRLGTYGGAALFTTLALKTALLAALAGEAGTAPAAAVLLAGESVSRAAALHIGHRLPAVRRDGASYAAGRPSRDAFLQAWGAGGAIALLLAWPAVSLVAALLAMAAAAGASAGVGALAMRQIGGQTGDVAGAAQQAALAAFLATMLSAAHLAAS